MNAKLQNKKIVVGVELTSNVPSMTFGSASVVLVDTWFTFPVLGAGFYGIPFSLLC